MKQCQTYMCKTLAEVKTATKNLDIASRVPIQIVDGGVVKQVHDWVGIYNNSKGHLSTVVVPYYNLIQHKDYFDGFAEAMTRLGMNFTMSIKQQGDKAYADIDFPDRKIELKKVDEKFTSGLRLINSYDKSTGLYAMPRFMRLICSNGMIITEEERTISIKHHSKLILEIQSFIETRLQELINMDDTLKRWVNESMVDSLEWKFCCRILEKLFIQPKHREEILKRLGINMVEIQNKKTKKITYDYVWNDVQQKKTKLTRWEIYNAITQYLTHGQFISPHIENLFSKHAEKLLITPLIKMPKIEVKL